VWRARSGVCHSEVIIQNCFLLFDILEDKYVVGSDLRNCGLGNSYLKAP